MVLILCVGVLFECVGWCGLMFVLMMLVVLFNLFVVWLLNWYLLLVWCVFEGFVLGGVLVVVMVYFVEEIVVDGFGFLMGFYVGGIVFGGMIGWIGMSVFEEYFLW